MFFTQINKFYDNTTIEWLDKESLKYKDNAHIAVIWVDYGPGIFKVKRILKTESLNNWKKYPAGGNENIDENKKKEIILKVQLYYALQKVICEVD